MSTKRLTFNHTYSAVDVRGNCGFISRNDAVLTLYTNETLDAGYPIMVNAVLLDLKNSSISIGLFPAHNTAACQNNRVGSAGLPGSVACQIGNGRARVLSNGTEYINVACSSNTPVYVQITVMDGIVSFLVNSSEVESSQLAEIPLHGDVRVGVSPEAGQQRGALVEKAGPAGVNDAQVYFLPVVAVHGGGHRPAASLRSLLSAMQRRQDEGTDRHDASREDRHTLQHFLERDSLSDGGGGDSSAGGAGVPHRMLNLRADADGHRASEPETCTTNFTFHIIYPSVDVRGYCGFISRNDAVLTLYTNETLDASLDTEVNAVLLDLKGSSISIGLLPACNTDACQNNRVGSAGLPGSVACKIGNGRARVLSSGKEWSIVSCDSNGPVLVQITIAKGVVTFFVDGNEIRCPLLAKSPLDGELRVGVSTETGKQRGALVPKAGLSGIADAEAYFLSASGDGGGSLPASDLTNVLHDLQRAQVGSDSDDSDDHASEVGPLNSDPLRLRLIAEKGGPIAVLTPTVFRCNETRDGTIYASVALGTEEMAAIGVSVRFTGIKRGCVGCGLFRAVALDSGEPHQHLVGKTEDSIGCLLKSGEVFVFINDNPVFCSPTPADTDELTMHFSFDRKTGMHVLIENAQVNCDEFKDLSLFSGDLYFAVSLSEVGQLARILPSGLGAQRFHYGMNSMDVADDKLMNCKHSVRASLSANERWYGNAEKVFTMRITNVRREPVGIGLVSAKLWNNGRINMVGGKEFGPHSIGLLIKDRRIYVHYQDEFVEWRPVARMPPIPRTVDLVMRVSGGKVSFFYQGIPVVVPAVAELTLPSDERFRVAYTMSDKGQAAVIPPNVAVRAPDNVAQRCSLLGDAVHVKLAGDNHSAQALFAGALCLSSKAFALTPSLWYGYPQGCSGCEDPSGTLWLCAQCGAPEEFTLCDSCYWDASQHKPDHHSNQFIPVFGAGISEMRLTVEDARNSYMEVGVAPASYEDGFGAFAANTSVVLGQGPELVKCSMPASKFAAGCAALRSGDEVCLRVVGAALSVLVNGGSVFETTLSVNEPFMTQPLRFAVRMGYADQAIRVHRTTPCTERGTFDPVEHPATSGSIASFSTQTAEPEDLRLGTPG